MQKSFLWRLRYGNSQRFLSGQTATEFAGRGEGKAIRKQLEVDFVCNLGSSRYYIQSAYSLPDEAKRIQEIRPFRKIDDSFKKIIITKDIVPAHYDEYGILTINVYDFLLDPGCLEK